VRITAVAFDLDGTLYPGWTLYMASADMGITHPLLLSAFGWARKQIRARAFPGQSDIHINTSLSDKAKEFRKEQAFLVAKKLNTDNEEVYRLLDELIYTQMPEKFRTLHVFPGVVACLDKLKAAGYPLALLSDLPPERKMELLGLDSRFDYVSCSEYEGTLKPSIEPFLKMARELGKEPREILYIGNREQYDVGGAKRAGMQTALFSWRKVSSADFTFRDWDALPHWIVNKA
jgi:putative hydrolase of the HAD superfamily